MRFGDRVRVLVVDDEPSICRALAMALTRAGYDVVAMQSGDGALAHVRRAHVDVLLIDLRIPDTRGDVVFELAAAEQPHLRTQTLFMTGDISDKANRLVAACHCNFLTKPFDLNDMLAAVGAIAPRNDRLTG